MKGRWAALTIDEMMHLWAAGIYTRDQFMEAKAKRIEAGIVCVECNLIEARIQAHKAKMRVAVRQGMRNDGR